MAIPNDTNTLNISGVALNDITILRGRLNAVEQAVALQLLHSGMPRWLAAAKLGVHPLAIPGGNSGRQTRRKPRGLRLDRQAALCDPRQIGMLWAA